MTRTQEKCLTSNPFVDLSAFVLNMKIKAIHHAAVPLPSKIRNAVIDFSQMTFSLVVVESDIVHGGKPLCGFGFNSNGRYAQPGVIDERCIPRLMNAEPSELTNAETGAIDSGGLFTTSAPGTCSVSAAYAGLSATATVTVEATCDAASVIP